MIPLGWVKHFPVTASAGSKAGIHYVAAGGAMIPNQGEQRVEFMTGDGHATGMTFQVGPVTRPLGSVKKICAKGNRVVFDDDGSYILNKKSNEKIHISEESGVYVLDGWILPGSSFTRRGQ